ncbi:stage III sporulation protein AA [Ruminiclostridium papyrosolvens DSM 2782]|uniref:Stage III sporulation protein AA n=1 Tax=Ruminiclostridium papyrosolvens DSM 2782 TaxID=588581 RepID=F1TAM0_9FIRM|nr:stage III sporulation protein AA [Ruminiclostridium papyrosolvens]EGD48563.1 stage III sporulation protein AA [Ruminiclostridium papyrosolvens DSM 2782]WES32681.1 stage III sporulation protein AA [Ruminiclostridium papyrosolvens DSM 2782]
MTNVQFEIFPFLIPGIREVIQKININELNNLEEIRLRAGKPLMVFYKKNDWFVTGNGRLTRSLSEAYLVEQREIIKTLELMSENSIYAYQDEIKSGYITLRGGHRIGLSGKVVLQEGKIRNIKDFNGLNIRIAKEVRGCAKNIIKYIIKNSSDIYNTLIVGPPQCGKTTILRDLSRMLSSGEQEYDFNGMKVGIVDERSEIAACCKGVPQNDVGYRTDVMDGCPKVLGMEMLLRSMSPGIIITDEIGTHGDRDAVLKVLNSGIKIIASAHGYNITELKMREELLSLIKSAAFERYIVLSSRNGPGTLEEVVDEGMTPIYRVSA